MLRLDCTSRSSVAAPHKNLSKCRRRLGETVMIWVAGTVLVIHALIALFIVVGLPAIWVGSALGWQWVRLRCFRLAHLFAIGLVSILSLLAIPCPLTALEDWLRNDSVGAQGFIQRWVSRLLYYDLPAWAFSVSYVAFALMVLLTWRRIPPRQRK
jgi:hypothetical protein